MWCATLPSLDQLLPSHVQTSAQRAMKSGANDGLVGYVGLRKALRWLEERVFPQLPRVGAKLRQKVKAIVTFSAAPTATVIAASGPVTRAMPMTGDESASAGEGSLGRASTLGDFAGPVDVADLITVRRGGVVVVAVARCRRRRPAIARCRDQRG